MSAKEIQAPANTVLELPTCLLDSRPSTGYFKPSRLYGVVSDAATDRPTIFKNRNSFGRHHRLLDLPVTPSHRLGNQETQMLDTEMLDASEVSKAPTSNATTKSPFTRRSKFPCDDDPLIYIDPDGDNVEITRIRPCSTSSPYPLNSSTRGKQRFSRNSTHQHAPEVIRRAPCYNPYRRGRVQSRQRAGQHRSNIVAPLCTRPLSEEPEIQILDNPIARHFPVSQTEILSGHHPDELRSARRLNKIAANSPQVINEDDEAAPEDFASQDLIEDCLRSLVISSPNDSVSQGPKSTPDRLRLRAETTSRNEPKLCKGVTVELHNGSFLWIDSVREDCRGLATIKGYRLERDTYCGSRLPDRRLNELVWINEVDEEGYRAGLESILHEERVSEVKRARKVVYTNRPWSEFGFHHSPSMNGSQHRGRFNHATIEDNGELYCRWKYVQVNSKFKADTEARLTLLTEDEAEGRGRFEASKVRRMWRGGQEPVPGGAAAKPIYDVDTEMTTSFRQYTLGDSFCGAGGVSRGAIQAGLKVAWGFDGDDLAIETHKKNFEEYGTESLVSKDFEFIDLIKENAGDYYVDIAHYSPPCQPFSSANHNKNEERDFANQKALFSLYHLTKILKPRIATIEETAGLMHRHTQWFDTLIHIFTSLDYSIRWRMVRCQDFGIPQSRVRLLLTAAAPGERLPKFPAPTHGQAGSGLKPFVKIRDAIYNIPTSATHQDMISESKKPYLLTPYSDRSFAKCITTTGGQFNHHPSGQRKYNLRELACLQSFPTHHMFSTRGIVVAMKQVGNAVPPRLAKAWFEEIIKSLKETDGVRD